MASTRRWRVDEFAPIGEPCQCDLTIRSSGALRMGCAKFQLGAAAAAKLKR
jgi:hypothetical protein